MLYVGLDVHTTSISICVLNCDGKRLQQLKVRTIEQMIRFLQQLDESFQVCFEASTGYGQLFELLSPLAEHVTVAHPGALTLIFRSKQKNDRRDAEKLAKLLYLGEVPAVHVPTCDVRAWREVISFRKRLVEKRTRAKNGLRALLRTLGIKPPPRTDLWSSVGIAWLNGLEFEQRFHTMKRDLLLDELQSLKAQIKRVEKELAEFSKDNIAVAQLQSIPGIGPRTAEAIVAYLDDPKRFPTSKAVGSYFGLVPSQDQSGGRDHKGRITREGPPVVRQLMIEAVWSSIRHSATVQAYYERIRRDDKERKKIAIVATAHYLVRVMWSMLRNGTLWRETVMAA